MKKPNDIIIAITEELNKLKDKTGVTIDPERLALAFNHDNLPVKLYTLLYHDADDNDQLHLIEVRFKGIATDGFEDFHLDRWVVIGARTLYEYRKVIMTDE